MRIARVLPGNLALRFARIATVLPVLIVPSAAQLLPRDTAEAALPPNVAAMSFERNVNTFVWNLNGKYGYRGNDWAVGLDERFLRTLIRSGRENVKDEQTFRFDLSRLVFDGFDAVMNGSSYRFSDNRSIGLNDVQSNSVLAGISMSVLPWLVVSPTFGYAFDTQQGIEDQGWSYDATAQLRNVVFGDSRASAELHADGKDLNPRLQQEQHARGELVSVLGSAARNRAALQYRMLNRDFYLAVDSLLLTSGLSGHPIESRREQLIAVSDNLQYDVIDNLSLISGIDASQRIVGKNRRNAVDEPDSPYFPSNIEEFILNGSAAIRYRNPVGTTAEFRIELNERSEQHTIEWRDNIPLVSYLRQQRMEEQKDNAITQTQLSLSFLHPMGEADTVSLSGSSVKMVYNTPSSLNVDDRDELFLLADIRWLHRFTPWLLASLTMQTNLRHTVYISSERSAGNTWNRVFRISPSSEFRFGSRIQSKTTADVVANYTVYDFANEQGAQPSFSLRQLTITDSTTVLLGLQTAAFVQLWYRVYEQGEIHWSAFTVRPVSYVDERSFSFGIQSESPSWTSAAGFRFFQQIRYAYNGTARKKQHTLLSYGPIGKVRMRTAGGMDLVAEGWYQMTTETGASLRVTPNLALSLVWNL